jgi:small subunit ribosomal protein S19e
MTSVYEVPADKFLAKLAEELEKIPEFKMPEWVMFVKTGPARARPPVDRDFWYKRAGSILRQAYLRGIVGVGRLKTKYGGRKKRGVKPAEFRKAGGKIIRVILQQAEKAGFVEKSKSKKAGRQLTKKGKEFLDKVAGETR